MKNYKNAVPILLVFLMILSVYNTFSNAAEKNENKNDNLALARESREKGVIQDALTYYQAAMEIEDDFKVELEVGEMLSEAEMTKDAEKWGEHLVEKFPKEKEGYSFLLKQYVTEQEYEECFQLNDKAVNNKCVNKEFASIMEQIAYLYEYGYEEYEEVTTFSAGIAAGAVEGNWKLIDVKGNPCASGFLQTGLYNGEVISVQTDEGWMYVTSDGNKKIDVEKLKNCELLGELNGGIITAKCDGTYGYYDSDLKKIADGFDYATTMNEGVGAVCTGDEWKLIDSAGKAIGEKVYQKVAINVRDMAYQNERAWVSEDGYTYYMVDKKGNRTGKESVDDTKGFTLSDESAAVKQDGKWGFMDKEGKIMIEPQYEDARSFCNGYAAVKQNGKWGFINKEGTVIIEPQFSETMDFSDGSVFVKRDDAWILLKLYRNNYE